jgi:hypothetical protein
MSIKNSTEVIGNRTRDLLACSAVPQPTAPSRAPVVPRIIQIYMHIFYTNIEISNPNVSLYLLLLRQPDGDYMWLKHVAGLN